MKKKKNRILSVSGAALCLFFPVLLAACSQEDALPRPLEVSAEVGNPATRATDAHADDYDKREFVAGDVIRITDGTKSANYQRVVTGTTGTWQPASGQTALTTTGSETFTASYPTAFTRILADQHTGERDRVVVLFRPRFKLSVILVYAGEFRHYSGDAFHDRDEYFFHIFISLKCS